MSPPNLKQLTKELTSSPNKSPTENSLWALLSYFFLNIYIETVSHSGTQEHLQGSTGMNHELHKI